MKTLARPTEATYEAFQTAYDRFNRDLFGMSLPPCLITLQRKDKRTLGYFWGDRFGEIGGVGRTDEIAMNPQHFISRDARESLSTLAHEMVHLWQHHFGKASRSGYHNKQWASKMKEVGLYPSSTGELGGKEVGQKMTHYIVDGGPFDLSYSSLQTEGFALPWGEIIDKAEGYDAEGDEDSGGENKTNRVKYICPGCDTKVWGKPALEIYCGPCKVPFQPSTPNI